MFDKYGTNTSCFEPDVLETGDTRNTLYVRCDVDPIEHLYYLTDERIRKNLNKLPDKQTYKKPINNKSKRWD